MTDDHGRTTVERVPVELASIVGESATIRHGLVGGERIVSEGASFVEPGRHVVAVTAVATTELR